MVWHILVKFMGIPSILSIENESFLISTEKKN